MNPLFSTICCKWQTLGIQAEHNLAALLNEIQKNCNNCLPNEYIDFLTEAHGMKAGEYDEDLLHFNNCSEIEIVSRQDYRLVSVAEYSLNSHLYLLKLPMSQHGYTVIATDFRHEVVLAQSFSEFLELYNDDPGSLANCFLTAL